MRALFILLLLPLAGCHADPKPAALQCIAKAQVQNPRPSGQTEEEYSDSLGSPIADCMKAAGYTFEPAQELCVDGSYSNPDCYAASGPI
jgi:hypothetical protein